MTKFLLFFSLLFSLNRTGSYSVWENGEQYTLFFSLFFLFLWGGGGGGSFYDIFDEMFSTLHLSNVSLNFCLTMFKFIVHYHSVNHCTDVSCASIS